MDSRGTLRLRRETLTDLTESDLRRMAGAEDGQTRYSCLDYISCYFWQCVVTRVVCPE